jgi:uncharacterized protein DUF6600
MTIANRKINLSLVVLLLSWLLATPLFAQGDPPARVARLSYTKGTVSLQPSGATDWSQATLNYTVTTGDRIFADQGSEAELEAGPFAVRLSESTDLTIANLNDQIMQLGLAQGTIRVSVYQLPSGNTVEIDTPNGALTLEGAGDYRVDTNPTDGSTLVTVNSGSLQVTGGDVVQTVGSGQAVRLTGTNPIQIAYVSQPRQDGFDQWSTSRDRRRTSSASARYVSPYTPGYSDLDSSGRWQEDPQNGPVWYPSGVASNWVPYRNGHWAWVEPWGWTWVEDEPWGFAPFHYGRWAYVGSAWGWLPGPVIEQPYYAPALVAFVGGSGFSIGIGFGGGGGIQAWFPLGRGEPYFPSYGYSGDYLRQVNSTNIRNVTNISNITNINNINNINYANRQVATTAVPTTVFNTGQAVAQRAIPVTVQQVARAQIIARPVASPTQNAVVGGRPAPAPARITATGTAQRLPASSSHANLPAPLITKITPPGTRVPSGSPRTSVPPPARNNAPVANNASAGAPRTSPPLITRTAPPTRNNAPTANNAPAGAPRTSPPLITRSTPPVRSVASSPTRTPLPPPTRNNAPTANNAPAGAPRTSPPLITRSTPPARNVASSPPRRMSSPPVARNAPPVRSVASSPPPRMSSPPTTRSAPPARNVASSPPPRMSSPPITRSAPPARSVASSPPPRTSSPPMTRNAPPVRSVASSPQRAPQNPAPVSRAAPAPRVATSPGRPPATKSAESKKAPGLNAEHQQ